MAYHPLQCHYFHENSTTQRKVIVEGSGMLKTLKWKHAQGKCKPQGTSAAVDTQGRIL